MDRTGSPETILSLQKHSSVQLLKSSFWDWLSPASLNQFSSHNFTMSRTHKHKDYSAHCPPYITAAVTLLHLVPVKPSIILSGNHWRPLSAINNLCFSSTLYFPLVLLFFVFVSCDPFLHLILGDKKIEPLRSRFQLSPFSILFQCNHQSSKMAAFHVFQALICILFGAFVQTNNKLQYYQSGYKGIIMHEHTSMCLHNYPALFIEKVLNLIVLIFVLVVTDN